jgi:Peptidase family M28/PA domain
MSLRRDIPSTGVRPSRLLFLAAAALLVFAPAARAGTANDEMAYCAGLGAKRPGNAADRKMAAHIAERFRGAGLETHYEDFHMPSYVVRAVRLRNLDSGKDVPGETFAYGGVGNVDAQVVDVGTGRSIDYLGKDAKGKIVIVDRNEAFHRSSQLTEVIAHGGVAMLYVSGSPNNLVQTGAVRFAQSVPAPIPTVTVGASDGAALRADLQDGALRMRITVDAAREDVVGRNVIGIKKGAAHPDRLIVVGGHFDSWHGGAVDNCSAIGSMLEILETVKALKPEYTLVFGAWDAEEVGLVGSYNWAMRHQGLVRQTVLNENLEMTSAATYVGASRLDYSAINLVFGTLSPVMNALLYQAAARSGFAPVPTTAAAVRSISGGIIPTDLQPFYAQGVQGFSTFSSTPYYHTVRDDADKLDPASHERVTGVLRDVLVGAQAVPPEALASPREVPTVTVTAPAAAAPGAAVPVNISVTDPLGQPLTGATVKVLVNQRDHWAVDERTAEEVGNGRYRYTVPAGRTEADRTWITATVDQPFYIGQGFAAVDQTAGGPLARARACVRRRVFRVRVRSRVRGRRVVRVRARTTRGRVRVRGRLVRLDLRQARRGTVRLTVIVRTTGGRTYSQRRTYRVCAGRRA